MDLYQQMQEELELAKKYQAKYKASFEIAQEHSHRLKTQLDEKTQEIEGLTFRLDEKRTEIVSLKARLAHAEDRTGQLLENASAEGTRRKRRAEEVTAVQPSENVALPDNSQLAVSGRDQLLTAGHDETEEAFTTRIRQAVIDVCRCSTACKARNQAALINAISRTEFLVKNRKSNGFNNYQKYRKQQCEQQKIPFSTIDVAAEWRTKTRDEKDQAELNWTMAGSATEYEKEGLKKLGAVARRNRAEESHNLISQSVRP